MMGIPVAFADVLTTRCRVAVSSPRRAGGFSLLRQREVTKEEAPSRTPAPQARAAPCNSPPVSGQTRPASLSLRSLSPAPFIAPVARLTRGCKSGSREIQVQSRSVDAITACTSAALPLRRGIPGEPGVTWGAKVLVTTTAAKAQRLASERNANGCGRATRVADSRSGAVQGIVFGDLLLASQKKTKGFGEARVTPPPGGTPGNAPSQPALRQSNRKATPAATLNTRKPT
jgi:hypothetical protein